MPSWLRASPELDLTAVEQPREPAMLGARADPRTFLTDDDFPRWLRDLAIRETPRAESEVAAVAAQIIKAPDVSERLAVTWPAGPGSATAASPPTPATPELAVPAGIGIPEPVVHGPEDAPVIASTEQSPPAVATRPRGEPRGRNAWETLLLVLLFLGVVVAAIWALVANGVFSPGI
jgi:hypothetical protein